MASFGDTEQMGPGVSAHRQAAALLSKSSPRGGRGDGGGRTSRWPPPENRRILAAEPHLPETPRSLPRTGAWSTTLWRCQSPSAISG